MKIRYEKTIVGNGDYRRVDAWQKIDGDWVNIAYASVPINQDGKEFTGGKSETEKVICLEKARANRRASRGRVPISDGTY
jgi:hypothetical protein